MGDRGKSPPGSRPARVDRRAFLVASGAGLAGLGTGPGRFERHGGRARRRTGAVDDPVLPLRRCVARRHLGHEARRAGRVPRAVPADRDDGARRPALRAPADAGPAGASPGRGQLGRRARSTPTTTTPAITTTSPATSRTRASRRSRNNRTPVPDDWPYMGCVAASRAAAASAIAQRDHAAAQAEQGALHAARPVRRAARDRARPALRPRRHRPAAPLPGARPDARRRRHGASATGPPQPARGRRRGAAGPRSRCAAPPTWSSLQERALALLASSRHDRGVRRRRRAGSACASATARRSTA